MTRRARLRRMPSCIRRDRVTRQAILCPGLRGVHLPGMADGGVGVCCCGSRGGSLRDDLERTKLPPRCAAAHCKPRRRRSHTVLPQPRRSKRRSGTDGAGRHPRPGKSRTSPRRHLVVCAVIPCDISVSRRIRCNGRRRQRLPLQREAHHRRRSGTHCAEGRHCGCSRPARH